MRPPASTSKGDAGREWGRSLAILSEVDHVGCGAVGLVLEPIANSQRRQHPYRGWLPIHNRFRAAGQRAGRSAVGQAAPAICLNSPPGTRHPH